jgi:indolepyruvate ferredoxin oxidoreductase alpha subunit
MPKKNMIKKVLLSGNEAIARGAFEAGVSVASAYPGTPSTEILENIIQYKEIYAEWAPNEKVAVEVATGASIAGARALATMKHVGVNVAADPLFTASYTGVRGGLVIVTADDPDMHSSQNEQDNRNYAKFAKIPMLEPADSQEAKEYVRIAFELSEQFDTPVFIRLTTRTSHAKSVVTLEKPRVHARNVIGAQSKNGRAAVFGSFLIHPQRSKFVMLPQNARARHPFVEERLKKLGEYADTFERNEVIMQDTSCGIITSGVSYHYARESFPDYSFLKLAMVYPLPVEKIRRFASQVKKLYVFEELDPFFEEQIKALGIEVTGKSVFPICGEFNPSVAALGIAGIQDRRSEQPLVEYLPPRPPNMCPGCPHRGIFYTLKKMNVFVAGDIGCYTLGALPPLKTLDTCICMGGGIGHAQGIDKALRNKASGTTVAVIGDSTFLHSGITGLLNIVYNRGRSTVIILDNRTTAMTGRQEHPGTGYTLQGQETKAINYRTLCAALGVEHIRTVDSYNLKQAEEIISEEVSRPETSVVIAERPCKLYRRIKQPATAPYMVKEDVCKGCKDCLLIGCPALQWKTQEPVGKAFINQALCAGCSICSQLCPVDAIVRTEENE